MYLVITPRNAIRFATYPEARAYIVSRNMLGIWYVGKEA